MSFDPVLPPFNSGDPGASFINSSCLDFLLIELVPMAYRVTNELEAGAQARSLAVAAAEAGLEGVPADAAAAAAASQLAAAAAGAADKSGSGGGTAGSTTGGRRLLDEDEERDAVFYRLEMLGYRVGQGLVERFSRDRPRFHDTLDVIKFLCKDLWTLVFRKQVDNLKTNHRVRHPLFLSLSLSLSSSRLVLSCFCFSFSTDSVFQGVYVLTDNSFRPFQRMSTEAGGQAVVRAQPVGHFLSVH